MPDCAAGREYPAAAAKLFSVVNRPVGPLSLFWGGIAVTRIAVALAIGGWRQE